MNPLYFYCIDCKKYTDAGYRWCYWKLENPGLVKVGSPVDLPKVLAAKDYWEGVKTSDELAERLSLVKTFLETHAEHKIIYGIDESFDTGGYLEQRNGWERVMTASDARAHEQLERMHMNPPDRALEWRISDSKGNIISKGVLPPSKEKA